MKADGFTAALLAGGKSRRMGRDKAGLDWEGQPLWQRQIALLESFRPQQILISGHRGGPYVGSKYEIVFDAVCDQGPLGGLKRLLESCTTNRMLVLAVDMPWINAPVLEKLLSTKTGIVPLIDGWSEGAAAVYPAKIQGLLENVLKSDHRSFQNLVRLGVADGSLQYWNVEPGLHHHFKSWNNPGDHLLHSDKR